MGRGGGCAPPTPSPQIPSYPYGKRQRQREGHQPRSLKTFKRDALIDVLMR